MQASPRNQHSSTTTHENQRDNEQTRFLTKQNQNYPLNVFSPHLARPLPEGSVKGHDTRGGARGDVVSPRGGGSGGGMGASIGARRCACTASLYTRNPQDQESRVYIFWGGIPETALRPRIGDIYIYIYIYIYIHTHPPEGRIFADAGLTGRAGIV